MSKFLCRPKIRKKFEDLANTNRKLALIVLNKVEWIKKNPNLSSPYKKGDIEIKFEFKKDGLFLIDFDPNYSENSIN